MASRDEDFGADLTLAEGDDAIWSSSGPAPSREARDWRSLYEQARARAERERSRDDAAEARAEELRRAEVDARGRAGSLKWQFDWTLLTKVETSCDRILIAGGANVEAEWEQGPAV